MAKVDFNNMQDDSAYSTTSNAGSDVGFFTLRNDNDEAIVRFMCDSTDDFEILTVHDIKIGDKYRKINCIRDFHDPIEVCPLCAAGAKINQRFFIKLIQYDRVTDPATGNVSVTPKAMIWERSTAYAMTLKSYLDNYGPLSDVICKIIRHGKAGDMQTTYEIVPNLNKNVYRDEIYVKDTALFGDFNAFGTIVMDKTYDDIIQFQMNGKFPQRDKKASSEDAASTVQTSPSSAQPAVGTYYAQSGVGNTAPADSTTPTSWGSATPRTQMPWDNGSSQFSGGGFERPRRY